MKVVVTAQGTSLDDFVDPRFGRCRYFLLVDSDNLSVEAIPNEFAEAAGGAGTQAAKFIVDKGIKALITGSVGPKAQAILGPGGVEVYRGAGTVAGVMEKLEQGKLSKAER